MTENKNPSCAEAPAEKAGSRRRTSLAGWVFSSFLHPAVLFLFPVSCWSTFEGILELMCSAETAGEEALGIAFALTGGIQLTLLGALHGLIRSHPRRKPLYLMIYAMTAFVSVGFGYGYYFRHLRAFEYAEEVYRAAADSFLGRANLFQSRFMGLDADLSSLGSYSHTQSAIESNQGGTCADGSGDGNGPRARGRRADARLFSDYQARFNSLSNQVERQVSGLNAELKSFDSTTLKQHHERLRAFARHLSGLRIQADETLHSLQEDLRPRFPGGRYTIVEAGIAYPCPDRRLEDLSDRIQKQSLPEAPPPPEVFEAHNPKAVVIYALRRLAGWAAKPLDWISGIASPLQASQLQGQRRTMLQNPPAAAVEGKDLLPLLLGVLVDFLIFIAAFAGVKKSAVGGPDGSSRSLFGVNHLESFAHHNSLSPENLAKLRLGLARRLGCSAKESLHKASELLERYTLVPYGWRNSTYVLEPIMDAAAQERDGLHELMAVLAAFQLAKKKRALIHLSELPEEAVPEGVLEWLEREEEARAFLHRIDIRVLYTFSRESFTAHSDSGLPRAA